MCEQTAVRSCSGYTGGSLRAAIAGEGATSFWDPHSSGGAGVWWERIPAHRAASTTELATVLRRLHALAAPTTFALPEHEPLVGLRPVITSADELGDNDRAWLLERLDTLSSRYLGLGEPVQRTVIHGDAWQGNVVVPLDGVPIVVDLDRVRWAVPHGTSFR
ncbi:phosphotransferase [Nocardia ignorata]|uniref:phosphotransferase n=1 Tax=Nocardia ignorata TaxID=145285 RepID=UPI00362D8543